MRWNEIKLNKSTGIEAEGLDPLSIRQQSHGIRGYTSQVPPGTLTRTPAANAS
ncbi:hypothetical protein [Anabaena azotica]|uniref:Uncharacterized protein n=1 Tax=Anabaena azotica FACHB-119 TaxID=947527 RepID=A0ABR8CYA8_9NOST|nr:hypothetical protein [Anabaena azotica]MBD2499153.1 hypothetical protein [Anabaena azotica FACHB-119]